MLVLAHLHRSVLTQQVHNLGHLAFKWRSSFAKALATLSPNFREKSPNSFYKMIHIYIILNNKYIYLQCKIRHVYMNFRQNFRKKKKRSPFQKKTLAETVHYIPKGLRKGNPFHGPFAQLSHVRWDKCYLEMFMVLFFSKKQLEKPLRVAAIQPRDGWNEHCPAMTSNTSWLPLMQNKKKWWGNAYQHFESGQMWHLLF